MINLIENNSVTINLVEDINSLDWTIVNATTIKHEFGNLGSAVLKAMNLIAGETYEVSFNVVVENGSLEYSVAGHTYTPITNNTYVQINFEALSTAPLTFTTSGTVTISNVIYMRTSTDLTSNSEDTITFSEERGGWVTFKSFIPDCGFSMYTNLFTFKDGYLYKHDKEEAIPNNFYGVQYHSEIRFPVTSVGVKTYNSISVHSNKVLATTEDGIETQLGQVSDLIVEDFQTKEGVHSATFLRDKLTGLTDGEKLKGRYVVIELTDEESATTKMKIFKVVVKSNISSPNE